MTPLHIGNVLIERHQFITQGMQPGSFLLSVVEVVWVRNLDGTYNKTSSVNNSTPGKLQKLHKQINVTFRLGFL